MKVIAIANFIISLLFIIVILHFIGFSEVISELQNISLFYLSLSIISLFAMDLVMSYRINIILKEVGVKLKFVKILSSHFVGMLLADFTPSRTGYFAAAAMMSKNYNVSSEKALLSVFGPQIFDFIFKLLIGSAGVLYLLYMFIGFGDGLIFVVGSLLITFLIGLMLLVLFSKKFLSFFSFLEKIPLINNIYVIAIRMQGHSNAIISKTPEIVLLILVGWNFRALSWYFAAKSVGVNIETEFPEIIVYYFLQPLITMLEFVPSPTLAGMGLSEGGSTLVFSLLGVLPAKAILFALVARFKSTLLHLIAVPEAIKIVNYDRKA